MTGDVCRARTEEGRRRVNDGLIKEMETRGTGRTRTRETGTRGKEKSVEFPGYD